MYIEFAKDTKYAPRNAETSENHEVFRDCGYLLEDNEVVVDIDHLNHQQIEELIKRFNMQTQVVWTDRGAHLYYKKPDDFVRGKNGVCALCFYIETKTSKNAPRGITIKRNGQLRRIDREGAREYLPWYFYSYKKFPNLIGIDEGEGRNNQLFTVKSKYGRLKDCEKYLRFINEVLFAKPLEEKEFETVCRDDANVKDDNSEYTMADRIMEDYRTVIYQGTIWWWNGKEYITDAEDDHRLKKKIYEACRGENTRYIDEVVKQIIYRADRRGFETFPIRFENGILLDGQFYECEDYQDFTPYFIRIKYKPDAEPVPEIDDYINQITSNDEQYKMLLLETMAYPLLVDAERMKAIAKFFILRGQGGNGKGTYLTILKKIYNDNNVTALSIKEISDPRYQVTMTGKLANLGDDIQPDAINNDQMKVIKNITTADTISVRKLYRQSESTVITAKLFFTTNADIKTFEKGYAYKRRVMWLPMFNTVAKPDPTFITRMTSEKALEYWIRLIIEAYQRLWKNGHFTDSNQVDDFNKQYHKDNNYMATFLDTLEIDEGIIGRTGKEVRKIYEEYNDDDTKPYRPKLLNDILSEMGIETKVIKEKGVCKRVYVRKNT